MSTPLASPSTARRSPAKVISSEDNSALSSIQDTEELNDDEVDEIVLTNPTSETVPVMIARLKARVEDFGLNTRSQEDWKELFEDSGEALLLKMEALRRVCGSLNMHEYMITLTQLHTDCEKYIEQLRDVVQREQNTERHSLIAQSKLTPGRDVNPFQPSSRMARSPVVAQPGGTQDASPIARHTPSVTGNGQIPVVNVLQPDDSVGTDYHNPAMSATATGITHPTGGSPRHQEGPDRQTERILQVITEIQQGCVTMQNSLTRKANAGELADTKADVIKIQQLLGELNVGAVRADVSQNQKLISDLTAKQDRQSRLIELVFQHIDKSSRNARGLEKEVRHLLSVQAETDKDVKILKDVTNADLIPRGFTPGRRVNFTPQTEEIPQDHQCTRSNDVNQDLFANSPDRYAVSEAFRQSRRMPTPNMATGIAGISACYQAPATTTVPTQITTTVTTNGVTTTAQSMSSARQNVMSHMQSPHTQSAWRSPFQPFSQQAGFTPAQSSLYGGGTPGATNNIQYDRAQALTEDAEKLIARLDPPLGDKRLDKQMVLGLHKSKLPGVESERRELAQALDRYLDKNIPVNMEMLKCVREATSKAKDWANGIRDMYNTLECNNKDFDEKLFSSLKKFSDKSDMSVFEFIAKFESYTKSKGDEYKRADLLYNEYLDREIQERVVQFKTDYQAMKRCLFSTYGNVRNITNKLFSKIKESVPSETASESELYRHYKGLNYAIQRTAEMTQVEGVPRAELENHIYSVDFIGMLKELLVPYTVKYEYMEQLETAGFCNKSPSGETPFQMYVTKVSRRFKRIEDSVTEATKQSWKKAQVEKPRQKQVKSPPKKTYATVVEPKQDDSSEDEGQQSVHFTDNKQKLRKRKPPSPKSSMQSTQTQQQPQKQTATTQPKPTKSPKFPCGIHKGEHELGECTEFFGLKPHVRSRKWFSSVACPKCLGPAADCSKDCKQVVPKDLVCSKCIEYAALHNFRERSIVFCASGRHHVRPTKDEVNTALANYLKGYNDKKMGKLLVLHARVTAFSCDCTKPCKCKSGRSKTSAPVENAPVPAFDTQSGKLCKTTDSIVIKESPEDTVYVSQIISIGGRDVLVFYDRGANYNIIDGELAEELQFKVLTDKPSTMGTLSQSKVVAEYGTYAFCLGSEEESFFQLSAQGFDLRNQKFPFCDLRSINAEVAQTNELPRDTILPKFLGGQQIGILIGLKTPALEPQLVFQLPCGMGIYKSAIKDKFGSNYCYGGPHELFTKISNNKTLSANFSAITTYFTQMATCYNNSFHPALSHALSEDLEEIADGLCVISDKETQALIATQAGNIIETTAITEEAMHELGHDVSNSLRISEDPETGCIHPGSKAACTCYSHISAYKATVPIAKRKEYIDAPDEMLLEDTRCLECRRCKVCAKSPRDQVMSLNEQAEQFAIESSVSLDRPNKRVVVQLPFVKDPVEFLSKRHRGSSNIGQAMKIYEGQCRKNDTIKQGIRATHKDLLEKGFMKRLSALPKEEQALIHNADFRHYMPWRSVYKESVSTPVRMVVDASCTGINEVLAKGTNSVQSIFDILIRSRCGKHLWTSDISKLYNQLHLSPSAYPYSLFLFHESMEPKVRPDTYVLVRAWYGVTSTGNQSAVALAQIADSVADRYPKASRVVKCNLYVDDSVNANNSQADMEEEISHTQAALLTGGFTMKYIARSGQPPPPEASADGQYLKILGYVWSPEEDKLSLGFNEINFNKKRRGQKKSNPFPVKNSQDLTRLLKGYKITRRMVVAKIAELFDPIGMFEPYKLQLKLDSSCLNGLDWDTPICREYQQVWEKRFHEMLEFPSVVVNRCVVPETAVDPDSIRLLAVADAAEHAGGAAVYASWLLQDGTYSCQLLTSRSKLLSQTIPRNELESIKIMSDLVLDVKRALGDRVKETLYFSDSTVAICWVHTVSKRLRMYTLHRVVDIRANMCGRENVLTGSPPLYHIDGKVNIADLLTKKHSITPLDLTKNSTWQTGYPWMRLPLDQMPITTYEQLTIKPIDQQQVDKECFPTPFLTGHVHIEPITDDFDDVLDQDIFTDLYDNTWSCDQDGNVEPDESEIDQQGPQCDPQVLHTKVKHTKVPASIDLRYYGYEASIRKLSLVIQSISQKTHTYHVSKGTPEKMNCLYCRATKISNAKPFQFKMAYRNFALEYLLRQESRKLKQQLSPTKIKQYTEINGILYYHSRITEEVPTTTADIDTDIFFDGHHIKSLLPVVSATSDLFLVYAIYVHEKVKPHSGIESTLSEIFKTMFVFDNPRRVLKQIRNKCPRCRLIRRKTLELRVMNHPQVRTELAPPFYNVMIDTVFGFKCQSFKGARGKVTKMYALIIVCLLTGAVNILAINGLETQDVIQGLERHSAKHGIPKAAYVDNGTQLICLNRAEFDIRDLQSQVQRNLGLEVIVSTPKSHEERGRVEAKVKALRTMMDKLVIASTTAMTALEWETLFQKVSSMLNDIPIAKSSTTNVSDIGWDIITPNRLLLGRNHYRSLEGSIRIEQADNISKLLHKNNKILQAWYGIFASRIHHLIPRPIKWKKDDPVHVGDVVLFLHTDNPMDSDIWDLGRVEKIIKPTQIEITHYMHSGKNGKPVMRSLLRSPRDISIIQNANEQSMYIDSEDC